MELDLSNVAKITDPEVIAKDAFDAGWEGRLSCNMPAQYADVGNNWRIWADEYQSGERDARDDVAYYQADAQAPDATGQSDWLEDRLVDESL